MRGLAAAALIAVVGSAPEAGATCATPGLGVLPPSGTEIPTNPIFVLSMPDESGIEGRRPRLVAGDRSILLRVASRLGDGRGLGTNAQVELVPDEPLAAHTRYELRIEPGQPSVWRTPSWTSGAGPDLRPPVWTAPPTAGRREYQMYGCGPDSFAFVDTLVEEDGPGFWARVALRALNDRVVVRRMVWVNRCEVAIGRSMCGGLFTLEPGRRYVAELTAVDLAGNEAASNVSIHLVGPSSADMNAPWTAPAWMTPGIGLARPAGCARRLVDPTVRFPTLDLSGGTPGPDRASMPATLSVVGSMAPRAREEDDWPAPSLAFVAAFLVSLVATWRLGRTQP